MARSNIKICGLCHKEINLSKDNYVRVTDYFKGKFATEGFYHTKCWDDKFNYAKQMKDKTMELLGRASKLLPKQEVKYEIR